MERVTKQVHFANFATSGHRRSRYSPPSYSPSPERRKSRRKSFSEQALGALGLGGGAAAADYKHDRDYRGGDYRGSDRDYYGRGRDHDRDRYRRGRSYSRSHARYPSSSPSRSRDRNRNRHRSRGGRTHEEKIAQAARAALTAGAAQAFRSRKDPGPWTGDKGKAILTAAVAAAGTDGLVDQDPNKHSKRHMIESTLAGLATSHLVKGGRSQSRGRDRDGRNKSSGGGGGLKDLASAGALAAAGKEIYDRISRSRSRPRGREGSRDSYDDESDRTTRSRSRHGDHRGSKKRSKSVSEYISKGMAALGLEEADGGGGDSDRRRDDRHRTRDRAPDYNHRRGGGGSRQYDSYSDSDGDESEYRNRDSRRSRGSREPRDVGRNRSIGRNPTPKTPTSAPRGGLDGGASSRPRARSSSESSSDLGDSDDEMKKHRKMKRDMLVTGGLATVATIHAAHNVHSSIEKRKQRRKALEEGKITPEEARKRRIKSNTLDAASIGLAALGIKGALGEWKEVNEKHKEHKEFKDECAHRSEKRHMHRQTRSQGPTYRRRWPDEIQNAPSPVNSWKHSPPIAAIEAPQATY